MLIRSHDHWKNVPHAIYDSQFDKLNVVYLAASMWYIYVNTN